MNFVDPALQQFGEGEAFFNALAIMEGETYREVASRRTFRFIVDGRGYFAKIHFGVGWAEIFKNLFSLRLPILGARNELAAIRRLEAIGVATMKPVAFVELEGPPASRRSAIVTEELVDTISLEDLALAGPVPEADRRKLVDRVARITCAMHEGGINHRDLYICHFHLRSGTLAGQPSLFVIDLHRAQVRHRTPRRWIVKDIAGLFFSTFDAGLSRRDYIRFIRTYSGKPATRALREDGSFWRDVGRRAQRLYREEFGDVPAAIRDMLYN